MAALAHASGLFYYLEKMSIGCSHHKLEKDADPDFDYGDMAYLHTVPCLGQLQPGQAMQSVEDLFRAPIYRHSPQHNDYLLIRDRNG
ncbi:hypothetical protein ANCDUO_05193 [Ancylostoma duodenale]|uniref:Transcription initiation factor TFIID subunit 1 histone acetyltransferase domain-containing protein n=1 Tax=Ancylostoma duodenale TaxID=51022 RepID=A0A0C2GZ79_9BILA|nr:hypothetical protein ANCDUO_05193 [Ancylostoma duodenale]